MITKLIQNRRGVLLALIAPVIGFTLLLLVGLLFKIEVSKLAGSIINFIVAAILAFYIFPRRLGIPFGKIETAEFLQRLGFYLPQKYWKHIVLGLVLAVCTLSGMWAASFLTGKYVIDPNTITLAQSVFSLNPAFWEELFYRGVMIFALMPITGSLRKAFVIQIVLFGLVHIKGFGIWDIVDAFSVMIMAIEFTFVAYKTRSLVAGIVFHYFHDALLFFVQLPQDTAYSARENVLFYGCLWLMVGVGCGITMLAAEKLGVQSEKELYV